MLLFVMLCLKHKIPDRLGPAGLVLGDELRLEAAMAVAWHFDGQFAELALEGLLALAVAGVASGVGHRLVAFMAQVLSQLGVQGSLDQQLGQLLEQAVLADEVFRFPRLESR